MWFAAWLAAVRWQAVERAEQHEKLNQALPLQTWLAFSSTFLTAEVKEAEAALQKLQAEQQRPSAVSARDAAGEAEGAAALRRRCERAEQLVYGRHRGGLGTCVVVGTRPRLVLLSRPGAKGVSPGQAVESIDAAAPFPARPCRVLRGARPLGPGSGGLRPGGCGAAGGARRPAVKCAGGQLHGIAVPQSPAHAPRLSARGTSCIRGGACHSERTFLVLPLAAGSAALVEASCGATVSREAGTYIRLHLLPEVPWLGGARLGPAGARPSHASSSSTPSPARQYMQLRFSPSRRSGARVRSPAAAAERGQ